MKKILNDLNIYEDIIVQNNLNGYWSPRKKIQEQPKYNHRKINIIEVPIDIDVHDVALSKIIVTSIVNRLNRDLISHSVWWTQRSFHIHIFYPELIKYSKETRNYIRKKIVYKYCEGYIQFIDIIKANENLMIRDFFAEHELVGGQKELIEEVDFGINFLPNFNIEKKVEINYELDKNWIHTNKLFHYALNNKITRGNRNNVLFKCLAIGLTLSDITDEERREYAEKIVSNCPGKNISEFLGWFKWCRKKIEQGNNLHINEHEVQNFIKMNNLEV